MSQKLTKVLAAIVILAAGYGLGFLHGHKNLQFEGNLKPKIVNFNLAKPSEVDFSLFWDAYDIIQEKSLEPLENQKALYGAISGLVQSLKDPFSAFLDPQAAQILSDDLKGEFGGIGAELAQKEGGRLVVVSPITGTPADKAGLKSQDEILKIDGQDVSTLSFGEAIVKIRGAKGTSVILMIVRSGVDKPFDVSIIRDTIKIESLNFREEGEIGIVRINQFGEDSAKLLKSLEQQIKAKKGIVVDVRNNPGGLLEAAIDVTSLFDDQSPIVIEQGKQGEQREFGPSQRAIFKDVKLVVLINEGSASASEIFAGSLKDHGRAKLVGTKTFGKGSVQNLEELKDDSVVRLTVANWLTPAGYKINGTGINPDIEVKHNVEKDEQLERAIELLSQK